MFYCLCCTLLFGTALLSPRREISFFGLFARKLRVAGSPVFDFCALQNCRGSANFPPRNHQLPLGHFNKIRPLSLGLGGLIKTYFTKYSKMVVTHRVFAPLGNRGPIRIIQETSTWYCYLHYNIFIV